MGLKCCYRLVCFLVVFFFTILNLSAQDSTLKYTALIYVSGSTRQTPFWLHANQNGSIPQNGSFTSSVWAIHKIYHPHNPRIFQWAAGAEVVANYAKSKEIFFLDLFIAGKIGPVEFTLGQKKSTIGLLDFPLTSGSLAMAGNARPFPRLQISIPEFLPIGFTNNLIAIKANYSDGRLGESDILFGSTASVPLTYFHQKSLYVRIGHTKSKIQLLSGINHQAIWGGENKISPIYNLKPAKAYWYTVTGKTFDHRKIGFHFGTIDLGINLRGNNWSYLVYRQNIYETGSLFRVTNFSDGLNGIKMSRNKHLNISKNNFIINSLLFEFLNTQNQTNKSPLSGLLIYQKGNYFNSYIYESGWSYKGQGIGTPLIPGKNVTVKDTQVQPGFTANNRIMAFHSGLSASWLNTSLVIKGTFSRNFGTHLIPYNFVKQQFSFQFTAEKKVKFFRNSNLIASFYSDIGTLYPNSTGLLLGIKKSGLID